MIYERIYSCTHHIIPRELILNNKEREYCVTDFYESMKNLGSDSSNFVYAIKERVGYPIIGFVWGCYNDLSGTVFMNTISIDKNYRQNGKALQTTIEYFKKVFANQGYDKMKILTKRPNWYLKKGWKKSNFELLEISTGE